MNMVVLIGRLVRDPSYSEVETEKGSIILHHFIWRCREILIKVSIILKLQLLENRQISQGIT